MRRILAFAVAGCATIGAVSAASAQERAGDAALGALSGAVVLGPVGAVAGAVVGYTSGPSIARAWGLKGHHRPRHAARANPPSQKLPDTHASLPVPRPQPQPGVSAPSAAGTAASSETAASAKPPRPAQLAE